MIIRSFLKEFGSTQVFLISLLMSAEEGSDNNHFKPIWGTGVAKSDKAEVNLPCSSGFPQHHWLETCNNEEGITNF